jgi:transposase
MPRLDQRDRERLETALERGPEKWGFKTHFWTLDRIAKVIEKTCRVKYHPRHVWRILRSLGWSRQRPARRAIERDEKAIMRWVRVRWPEVKKTQNA